MNLDVKTLVIIREATSALIDHAAGRARVAFEADRKTRSAVLFEIIIIGDRASTPAWPAAVPWLWGDRLAEVVTMSC